MAKPHGGHRPGAGRPTNAARAAQRVGRRIFTDTERRDKFLEAFDPLLDALPDIVNLVAQAAKKGHEISTEQLRLLDLIIKVHGKTDVSDVDPYDWMKDIEDEDKPEGSEQVRESGGQETGAEPDTEDARGAGV